MNANLRSRVHPCLHLHLQPQMRMCKYELVLASEGQGYLSGFCEAFCPQCAPRAKGAKPQTVRSTAKARAGAQPAVVARDPNALKNLHAAVALRSRARCNLREFSKAFEAVASKCLLGSGDGRAIARFQLRARQDIGSTSFCKSRIRAALRSKPGDK